MLVAAHGNSLRALSVVIDGLSQDELTALRLPTGRPLAYAFDTEPFLSPQRRGGGLLGGPIIRDFWPCHS